MKKLLFSLLLVLVAVFGFACGKDDSKVIKVGASSTPHAEVLEQVKSALKEKGYTLEVVVYDDYILPNKALTDGTIDANYFQHVPYLNSYNKQNGTDIVSAFKVHYEPFGIYGNDITDLKDLKSGATIIIPADDSNETRALLLLAQEGLIELKEGKTALTGITTLDIKDNKGYNVVAVQADTVPAQLKNSNKGSIAVINGNYAIASGLKIKDALAVEDASGDAAQTYANIIACRKGDENSDKIKVLVEVLNSQKIKDYIKNKYDGAVLPVF